MRRGDIKILKYHRMKESEIRDKTYILNLYVNCFNRIVLMLLIDATTLVQAIKKVFSALTKHLGHLDFK